MAAAEGRASTRRSSAKKLTQSQADDILAELKAHVADLVNAKPRRPLRSAARGAARGPRFFFGP